MKSNWKRLTGFVLLFALLCFLFWFHHRRIYLLLLFAMGVSFAVSLAMLYRGFPLPDFTLVPGEEVVSLGDTTGIRFRITCKRFCMFPRITVRYSIGNIGEDKKHFLTDSYSASAGEQEYGFSVKLTYCGVYRITCEEIRVYDPFGFFAKGPEEMPTADILVLPERIWEEFPVEKESLFSREDAETDPNAGQDVSEIKELREYREGDPLTKVHWKLSTKSTELIVKEYAGLAGVCLAIACCGDYDGLRSMTDYYEMLYSLGEQFLEEEQFFELVYQSPGEERLVMMRIDNAFDFKNTIQDMYYHLTPVSAYEIKEIYESENKKARLLFLSATPPEDSCEELAEYHNIRLYGQSE